MAIVNIDYSVLVERLEHWARKIGRISARPAVILYYVMTDAKTPKSDKIVILSAISYLIFPVDLISAKRLPFLGLIDEAVSLTVAYQRACKYVTQEIEAKADAVLDRWFPEYTRFIEIN